MLQILKINQEIKKVNAFEVAILSLLEGVICVNLWPHNLLIRYAKLK